MIIDYEKLIGNKKWIMYCISLLIGLAMGIINPLSTTHMTKNNTGDIWIGAISSAYFLFLAINSVFIAKKLRGYDIRKALLFGLLLTSVCSVVFPLINNRFIWFMLMSFMGIGISFAMVGMQTFIHKVTDCNYKAIVSGLYSFCFAIGFIISSIAGPIIYENMKWVAFLISAVGLFCATIIINFKLNERLIMPIYDESNVLSKIYLALFGAFAYGFSETTLISIYPLFMIRRGFELSKIGYILGIFIIGSMVGTLLITYIADKFGREMCLGFIVFLSLFILIGITIFSDFNVKLVVSFLGGFIIGPIYPLSLALSVDKLKEAEVLSGTALFTFTYGIGATIGPFTSSVIMNLFGTDFIFSGSFVIFIVMMGYIIMKNIISKKYIIKKTSR